MSEKIFVTIDPDLEDLIPGYLDHRRKDVERVRTALKQGDNEIVQILGHRMNGTGASYGFKEITDYGSAIEEGVKAGNRPAIEQAVKDLADYLERVEVVYA